MVKKLKRAFTITELVIVIAVIAILAAVLIPTFTSLIDKANQSSDQSAVRNMNLALQNAEVDGELETLSEALAILEDAGMNAKNYSTLAKNTAFVWVRSINRVLYISTEDYTVIYPEEYKYLEYDGSEAWATLEGSIKGEEDWLTNEIGTSDLTDKQDGAKTYGVVKEGGAVTAIKVDRADRLVSAAQYLDEHKDEDIDLYLGGNIDLEGAEWNSIDRMGGNFNGNGFTISNLRMTDTTAVSDQIQGGSAKNYTFYAFVSIFTGERFENVTIENVDINKPGIPGLDEKEGGTSYGNHTVAGAIGGIYKLGSEGEINTTISNVTVSGNIVGHSRVGGIVGFIGGISGDYMYGQVTISNCTNNATLVSDYSVPSVAGHSTAGGIVSIVIQTNTTFKLLIEDCQNTKPVTALHAAGILARLSTKGSVLITDCSNSGTITAKVIAGVNASGKVETILADTNYKDTVGTASGIFDTFQQTGDFKDTNTISGKTVNGVLIENCSNTGSFDKQVDNGGAAFTHDICVHGSADAKPWTLRQGTLTFTNCTGKDGSQINVATEGV